MATVEKLTRRFEKVFEPDQATVLAESIVEAYDDLVKTSDFNELKAIVADLARDMQELSQAQQRTEMRMDELAQAQQRTESSVEKLTRAMTDTRREMGGMSRSMAYALENEAYRSLPAFLEEQYDITLSERIVRTDIQGEEINFFALGERNGQPICLVGESKLQLGERRRSRGEAERVFEQIERKVEAVRLDYPDREIVRLLVTHYARPDIRHFLQENNIIVVQTFEW